VEITFAAFEDKNLRDVLYTSGQWLRKGIGISKAFIRRSSTMVHLKSHDLVYVFRESALFGPSIFERIVHHSRVPLVFDFDDAIFVRYRSPANGWLSLLKAPGKTRTICKLASHVMAGNHYLAEYARAFNRNVTVVPTTIDTDTYRVRSVRETAIPVIGWTGSYSTVQHLDLLRDVLHELGRLERFRLRVIGPSSYRLEGVDVEVIPWRSHTEVKIWPRPTLESCLCQMILGVAANVVARLCNIWDWAYRLYVHPWGKHRFDQDGDNGFLAQCGGMDH
jgi:hypothetical protein